jgi:phospholipid transport system substrate-binding protein
MKSILAILSFALLVVAVPMSAHAQAADPAVAQVQGFYDGLTAAMKTGGGAKARFDKLKPAVDKTFDLPGMTALAVGSSWAAIAPADQKALIDAFSRMTVANYAKNFDSYNGEKFTVDPTPVVRGTDKFVKSSMNTGKETIAFNYRMHQVGGDWKILDVYLAGNISQMAQKRSDFAALLASGGPQGLAKRINALTDEMLS